MEPQRKDKEQISEKEDEDLENRVLSNDVKEKAFLCKTNESARLCLWKYFMCKK